MAAKSDKMGSKDAIIGKKKKDKKGGACSRFLRKFFKFIFSNIGLLCLLVGYTVMGAYAFMMLEGENMEEMEFIDIINETSNFLDTVWNMTVFDAMGKENWTDAMQDLLDNYTSLYSQHQTYLETEKDPWSFLGSLVFCTTVTTSIGYGYIAPVTMGGRIFCMIYATFGIPLMFVVLINIGTIMADVAKCACVGSACKKKAKVRPIDSKDGKWADKNLKPEKVSISRPPSAERQVNIRDIAVEERKRDEEVTKNMQVPIIVILMMLTGYNCLGMLLFSFYMEWGYLEAFYFSFITLSTVGFGDLIIDDLSDTVFLSISALYTLVGLAVVSMCITLLTERFVSLATSVGKAIGLVKEEEEE
ncbi:potassium channel subfamily K member 18-like [Ptychodera flava]|uniref:potassium channel subfamily K member 18-like n=1 Tax=Ptychodera flava TaxID=63121 RepID=UPI003969D07E